MVREYKWALSVRSYEADAWGALPASGVLRYLEQTAVAAAADAGYGSEYHSRHGSAWVIRRMVLLISSLARQGDPLQITTWTSHFTKVRGGREYRIQNSDTGQVVAIGLAEWVYLDRENLTPLAIPVQAKVEFDSPGAPIGSYEAPDVPAVRKELSFEIPRTAEWHEADSLGHVNNAVYADWLNDALGVAVAELGWPIRQLRQRNLQLRGEYYNLDYKRAALPEDALTIRTTIVGISRDRCRVHQTISTRDSELLSASSVYRWRTSRGEPHDAPEGWEESFE